MRKHAYIHGALIAALALPTLAHAVDCRMPNGTVITMSLSDCPPDAAELDAEGNVTRPPKAAPQEKPRPASEATQPQPPAPRPNTPPAPRTLTPFDIISIQCDAFQRTGVITECDARVKLFTPSYLHITFTGPIGQAHASCLAIARNLRDRIGPGELPGWEVRMVSPFSGDRPIARCDL